MKVGKQPTADEAEDLHAILPRGPGGDALLSPELTDAMGKLVREGLPIDGACRVVGLKRSTLNRWLRKGQVDAEADADTAESRLAWALDRALGKFEQELVGHVMRGARADGRLAVEVLALRRPESWAVAAPEREDFRKRFGAMTEQELRAEMERLLAASAAGERTAGELPEARAGTPRERPPSPGEDDS